MKRVEVRVRDEGGKVISVQHLELDTGRGRFVDIERGVETLKHQFLAPLEGDLLEREQGRFVEVAKKGEPID
jgi:hypothetical protein